MKNVSTWLESKYISNGKDLRSSSNLNEVSAGSRLITNLIAVFYQKNIKIHVQGRLLDLGAGKVPLYGAYRGYITENVCVDWPNSSHDNKHIDFYCDLSKKLPFDDGEFDSILISDVIEHVPDPDFLWREIARVLKINGKVIGNTPFFYWIHEQPFDYYRFTEYALKRFASIVDLNVIEIKPIGGLVEVLADIFSKTIALIPFIGKKTSIFIQQVVFYYSTSGAGIRVLLKTASKFPLGYTFVLEKKGI
jgi:SAM-dependent methyltransferase